MEPQSREYYQGRERAERAAAEAATCPHAKRVHQQLAEHYQEIVRLSGDVFPKAEGDTAIPHFVVLTRG